MQTPTGPHLQMVPVSEEAIHIYHAPCWCDWKVMTGERGATMVHSKLIAQGWDWFIRPMPVQVI